VQINHLSTRAEQTAGEGDGKVEDDLNRKEGEGSRSCGETAYCQWPVFLEVLKVKKKKK